MTTYYVSNTADNGYAVGNDGNSPAQAQSKATPWLTLDSAITQSSANDTIIINGGAVSGTNVYTSATNYAVVKALTITGDNFPVLKRTGAVTRVLNIQSTGTFNLNSLIFDGENTASLTCVTITNQVPVFTVNVTGCVFKNALFYGIQSNALLVNLNVTGSTFTTTRSSIRSAAMTTGLFVIRNNAMTTSAAVANEGAALQMDSGGVGIGVIFSDNVVRATVAASTTAAVLIRNCRALVQRNRIYIDGPFAAIAGIWITSNAATLAEKPVVRWNYIQHAANNAGASGYGILAGADVTGGANDNMVNYPVIYGNFVTGTSAALSPALHGIMCGFIKGGCVTGNVVNVAGIALLSKDQVTDYVFFVNNIIARCTASTSGLLRAKGTNNVIFAGNTVMSNAAAANYAFLADNDGVTNSANITYVANQVYADWQASIITNVAVGSAGDFWFNDYDLPLGVTGTPYAYTGTTYATTALWAAAQELTAQTFPVGAWDKDFWNKIGMRPGDGGLKPPSGIAPPWGR